MSYIFTSFRQRCWFIYSLSLRNFKQRYKNSLLGILWPFLYMFAMLALYSTIFTFILKIRWQQNGINFTEQQVPFWLILFTGQILYMVAAEILTTSPSLIINVPNYVKKIIFPLELLPFVNLGVTIFILFINIGILIACAAFVGCLSWTVFFLPIILFQLMLWCLGIGWLFGALGVFFRDLQQITQLLSQILMFATPIFYSMDIVPEKLKFVFYFNPLVNMVETMRDILLWGKMPDWGTSGLWTALAALFAWISFSIFQRLRKIFADVL